MSLSRALMPSFQELTAFEAAGRHGSFTGAASELSLTQSAISKQIAQLEDKLSAVLFERTKGRIVLTSAGNSFLIAARKILQDYATATHSVMASAGSETPLKVAVFPTFASRWLISRLPDFLAKNPWLTINVVTRSEPFDLAASAVDAAIHFGSPNVAQAEAFYLCDEAVVAVASPACIRKLRLKRPEDFVRAVLLQQATRPTLWQDWFDATGFKHPYPLRGPLFDQFAMTSAAATAGMGVALLPSFLIERELAEGLLVRLKTAPLAGAGSYYVVVPVGRRHDPAVGAFVDWIVQQAAMSAASRHRTEAAAAH